MAEYIEREALLAAYDKAHVGPRGGARKLIEDAPAADVQAVVRCKDCVHRVDWHEEGYAEYTGMCIASVSVLVHPNHFCSHGERKDGDGNG